MTATSQEMRTPNTRVCPGCNTVHDLPLCPMPSHTTSKAMDAETLEALRGSIAKWEGIVAGVVEDLGPTNCPLCQKFIDNNDCAGCPVAARTGRDACGGSPYDEWNDAEVDGDPDRLARAAQAELDFLKSLLPTDAPSDDEVSRE